MGRRLLEAAGFDPDAEIVFTPDIVCGGTILNFYMEYGCLPVDGEDLERIADIANFNLQQQGVVEQADVSTVQQALAVIKESGIAD